MSNYSLTVNSTFQPFTYQELAAPLDRQELYHEKLAEEYDKLSTQADVLEAMGQNDRDKSSGAYSRYKAYSDDLRKEADNLYKFGLNTESRQRLSDLRRKYNTEIVPIQNAWSKREKEADDQMKASLQNPSLMFTRDARSTTLDDYLRNPTGGYGVINGANITAQMAGMAKNLAKQVRSGNRQNIDDYTYRYIEKYGLDENLIRNWQDSPTLSAMFKQVMESNGVSPEALEGSMNAQSIIDKSTGYAEMGMWNAMGEDKSHILEDYASRLYAQTQAKIAEETAKHGTGDSYGDVNITSDGVGIDTTEHYTSTGLDELDKLKAGHDALKASYFGRTAGQVNPMAVYEDYQKELKKHTKKEVVHENGTTMVKNVADENAARRAVLSKYGKYGVSDILSDTQYGLLSDMGYNSTSNNPSRNNARHSDFVKGFNNLVQSKSRYSVNMTKYDSVHDTVYGNINEAGKNNRLSGRIWELDEEGKIGSPLKKAEDVNLYNSRFNKEGADIDGVYYDPQFKGRIILRTSEGRRFVAMPDIIDNELSRKLKDLEGRGAPANAIAAMVYAHLNTKNKVQGETDSKI